MFRSFVSRSRALAASVALASLSLAPGAALAEGAPTMPPAAAAMMDASVTAALQGCRDNVKAHPGAPYEAQVFAQQVSNAYISGVVGRGKADGAALVTEANGYLAEAMKAAPDATARLLTVKAMMLKDAGRMDEAKATAKQAEDAYIRDQKAKGAKSAPPPTAPVAGTDTPSGPTTVSVKMTNRCPKAVPVGSGAVVSMVTPSDLAPNVPMSVTFAVGDSVWLFDKDGKPTSHVRLGAQTKSVEVSKSCRSLVAK